MGIKTYDPDQVALVFAAIPLGGYADGEFIRVTQTTEAFTTAAGTDGEIIRIKSGDRRMRITVPLMQSSDSNALLSAIHLLDLNTPNGAGIGVFSMTDLSGTTALLAPEAWIVGWPEQAYDKAASTREWVFECGEPKVFVGGN